MNVADLIPRPESLQAPSLVIHNVHSHVFTVRHVPARFLPLRLVAVLRHKGFARFLDWALRLGSRFRVPDALGRIASFCSAAEHDSQEDVLRDMMGFYPRGTRFGLLAMDFDFMGAGKAEYDYLEQLKGLEDIARDYAGAAFPFVALDPRREGLAELAIDCVERRGFQGFKIYPPFGYFPFDEALDPLLAYAEERGLPVITHCSFGSPLTYWRGPITAAMRVHPKTGERLLGRRGREFASNWSAPANYRYVLERHPRLRLCLGHMGGAVEWRNFLYTSWPGKSVQEPPPAGAGTWLETVIELMREYEGVYADIAYTAYDPVLLPLLKVLLADERLASRILFGSDSYMLQMDAGEREFSIRLRGYLGEKLFRKIADENPRSWLGEAGTRD